MISMSRNKQRKRRERRRREERRREKRRREKRRREKRRSEKREEKRRREEEKRRRGEEGRGESNLLLARFEHSNICAAKVILLTKLRHGYQLSLLSFSPSLSLAKT